MAKERTLIIIKPDGVQKKLIGEALSRFEKAGLDIAHLEVRRLKKSAAKNFYSHLKTKIHPKIYDNIIEYMTSGKVVICILEGENASQKVRQMCGPTNPKKAPKGTIRGDFGEEDMEETTRKKKAIKNIIHSSESSAHARREARILRLKKLSQ